jgi:hypothetical protein
MKLRINPRALRVAAARALASGPLARDLDDHSEAEQRSILAQAEVLIRAYANAKDDDLAMRRRGEDPAAAVGPTPGDLL